MTTPTAAADDDDDRVFCADDKFADVIRCLEARGWRRHPHASFPGVRLKWLNYRRIAWTASSARRQTLNHLQHAVHFSQKELFARALYVYEQQQKQQQQSDASSSSSVHAFFLRTFDLQRDADVALLAEWELYARALAALKHFAAHDGRGGESEEVDAACALAEVVVAAGAAFFSRAAEAVPVVIIDVDAPAWQPLRCTRADGASSAAPDDVRANRATRVKRVLHQLKTLDPQFDAVGCANRSVWICKPAHLSQGRGIRLLTSLDAILALRRESSKWVVQKYMEQPLASVQGGRKFDIRQWVLITSLAPLRVFWYAQCYLRFCSQPFSLERARLDDQFVHLSNYSVQKAASGGGGGGRAGASSSPSEEEEDSSGSGECELMWSSERFQEHLRCVSRLIFSLVRWAFLTMSAIGCRQEHGRDVWRENIEPQMQRATRAAILSTAPKLRVVGVRWSSRDWSCTC